MVFRHSQPPSSFQIRLEYSPGPIHILASGDVCMRHSQGKAYVFWSLLSLGAGALSGWLSRDGMALYATAITKPPLSPPGWVFPVVWTVLYILMGIGAARVSLSPPSRQRSLGLNLFVIQLAVNFLWSPIFFRFQAFGFGFFWLLLLWVLVCGMILVFSETDPLAGKLQGPYLLWLTFAAYLNFGVWYYNH